MAFGIRKETLLGLFVSVDRLGQPELASWELVVLAYAVPAAYLGEVSDYPGHPVRYWLRAYRARRAVAYDAYVTVSALAEPVVDCYVLDAVLEAVC